MFDVLFGWKKASKCKKQIQRLQCRLKLLKNKRSYFMRQLRYEVAELIKLGHKERALCRAEQLFKDENILTAYELIDYFCDFILIHMQYISRNKHLPNHINEAVSSLIFASARCVDLPELWGVRELFVHRYGRRFMIAASELYPGNFVNLQIKEKLMIQPVTEDIKSRLINKIAQEYNISPEIKAIDYATEPIHRQSYQVLEVLDKDIKDRTIVPRVQASNFTALEGQTINMDLQSNSRVTLTTCHYRSPGVLDEVNFFEACPIVYYSSLESQKFMQSKNEDLICIQDMYSKSTIISQYMKYRHQTGSNSYSTCLEHNIEKISLISSSGILSQMLDQTLLPLDIEENQSDMLDIGECQDKRLFKFRSSFRPKSEKHVVRTLAPY